MSRPSEPESPLVLGGHSFIAPLGNEPLPDPAEQERIVAACLDSGIRWFDTTYRPERLALGRALAALGRRPEAKIIAWNFFNDFDPAANLDPGPPQCWQPRHLPCVLDDLQTGHLDALVLHELQDPAENERQAGLAASWLKQGLVGRLGVWSPGLERLSHFNDLGCSFMVRPLHILHRDSQGHFPAARALGWRTFACTPFQRGWELDRLVNIKLKLAGKGMSQAQARGDLASKMLRYALYQEGVDRLIVASRRVEWIKDNVASAALGPLGTDELAELMMMADERGIPA